MICRQITRSSGKCGLNYATAANSSPMNRETFGAIEVTRADYQEMLRDALDVDARF